MSASLSLSLAKGETVTFAGVHQVSADDATPVNITGWTIVATVRRRNGTLLFPAKSATVTNGPAGQYTWSVARADTLALAPVDCRVDIWRTDAGSERQLALGRLALTAEELT